jgi:hypothetical protein
MRLRAAFYILATEYMNKEVADRRADGVETGGRLNRDGNDDPNEH